MAIITLIVLLVLMLLCIAGIIPLIILLARRIIKKALAIVGIILLGIAAFVFFCAICAGFLAVLV